VYDFTEEDAEKEDEPRGRNTLIALLNAFLTMWKASQANIGERTLGVAGFGGLLWLIVGDRGLGIRRSWLRIPAITFAAIWFVPGIIAAGWTLVGNLGAENMKRIRTWPLIGVFALTGLIGFRVFRGSPTAASALLPANGRRTAFMREVDIPSHSIDRYAGDRQS
jgi:hypothetical protein